jgi:hypothetical protein
MRIEVANAQTCQIADVIHINLRNIRNWENEISYLVGKSAKDTFDFKTDEIDYLKANMAIDMRIYCKMTQKDFDKLKTKEQIYKVINKIESITSHIPE